MIDRNIYRKTEGTLYRHFKQKNVLDRMSNKLLFLERKVEQIKKDIHECNIEIKDNIRAINYDRVNVQVSGVRSIVEDTLIESIEKLQSELSYTYKKKVKLKIKIRDYEKKTSDIDELLRNLTEKEMQIAELKYNDGFTNVKIAKMLFIGETTVRRKKNEIVEYMAKELYKISD